jgi:Uma2 family endonuclease
MTATAFRPEAAPRLLGLGCGPLTVERWLELPETPDQYELYEGVLVMAPPPDARHQAAVALTHSALLVRALAAHGFAMSAPTGVRLAEHTAFEPDVLFLSAERMHLVKRRLVDGAPDIVVEVLSPSTRRYDLNVKLPAYLAHGVREVWIIDLEAKSVAVHSNERATATCAFGPRDPVRDPRRWHRRARKPP